MLLERAEGLTSVKHDDQPAARENCYFSTQIWVWKTFSNFGRLLDLGFDCLASAEKERPGGKARGEGNKEAIRKGGI